MTQLNKMAANLAEVDLKAIFDEIETICQETIQELMDDKSEKSVKTSEQDQTRLCQRTSAEVAGDDCKGQEECSKTSKNLTKTDHVVLELIASEEDYINKLEYVFQNYEEWMNQHIGLIKTRHMIKNLDEILTDSRFFLQDLKQHESNSDPEIIAAQFLKNSSLFQKYTIYSKNQKTAQSAYQESHDKIKEREIALDDKLGLHTGLLRPVQRLAKYELLLKEMQRAQDVEKPRLAEAIELIQDVSQKSNNVVELEHLLAANQFKAQLRRLNKEKQNKK